MLLKKITLFNKHCSERQASKSKNESNALFCILNTYTFLLFHLRENIMAKERPTIGINGLALPIMPPERDGRVWAKTVRVMFYTPGFLAILLIKAGEPVSFGITVSLLMLASTTAIIGGLFVGSQSIGKGSDDSSSKIGIWSGALVLELLSTVALLCAVPPVFHELAHSALLHPAASSVAASSIGPSELIPAFAILPFMIYQLAGFGTLHYVVTKQINWIINIGIMGLILSSYVANRLGAYDVEMALVWILVLSMVATVFYGILKLKKMQEIYDANCPPKDPK